MRTAALFALTLPACASATRSQGDDRTVLGYAVGPVREAALVVVEDVAHPLSVVRVTHEGSVLTEGWIGACGEQVTCSTPTAYPGYVSSPWTTIEVRFRELGPDTAVEVEIEYESCEPGVRCVPERYASSGELERQILDGIRSRLASTGREPQISG